MTDDQPTTARRRRGSGPDIRTHKVTVRLSPAELETVAGRAGAIGVSVSRFLAESALTGEAPTLAERHSLIVELFGASRLVGAIGNHLHQLAKVARDWADPTRAPGRVAGPRPGPRPGSGRR